MELTIPKFEDLMSNFFPYDLSECDVIYTVNLPFSDKAYSLIKRGLYYVKPSRGPMAGSFIQFYCPWGIKLEEMELSTWFTKADDGADSVIRTCTFSRDSLFRPAGNRVLSADFPHLSGHGNSISNHYLKIDDIIQELPYNDGTFGLIRTPFRLANNWTNQNGTHYRKNMGISTHRYYEDKKMLVCSIIKEEI